MQYGNWLPYVLGTIIIIAGSTPVLFLPETLEEAKAKKARYRREAGQGASRTPSPSNGQVEPSGKQSALQEILHQAREFKDSTQFIWRNYNVCLLIFCLLVSVISRQSSSVLLQFASKKFNWSIAKVCIPCLHRIQGPANVPPGQPSDLLTWNIQSHKLSRHHASLVLRRCQVSQPPWQTSRLSPEPGKRINLDYWLPCHRFRTGSSSADLRLGDSLFRICVPHHCAQFGDCSCTSRSSRHALLGYSDLPIPRHPNIWPIVCLSFPIRLTFRRCLDGTSLLDSRSFLCDCHDCCVVHSSFSTRARRKRGRRAINTMIDHCFAFGIPYEAPETWKWTFLCFSFSLRIASN